MRITAAVLYDVNKPYSVETVELDPPRRGEVLIKMGAAGVCRSDLHFQKGEATIALPAVLGHDGSGTVEAVGSGGAVSAAGSSWRWASSRPTRARTVSATQQCEPTMPHSARVVAADEATVSCTKISSCPSRQV